MFLFIVPIFAIAKTTRIMVSQAIRGECHQVVKRIEKGYLIISTLFALVISAVFSCFFQVFRVTLFEANIPWLC